MITESEFLNKINEIAQMKCISISKQAAKDVHSRFKEFEPIDLDKASEEFIYKDERFDFAKLLKAMNHKRAGRLEEESYQHRISEGTAAIRFFNENSPEYSGTCDREFCRDCPHLKNCKVRGREWIKSINAINAGSLGKKGAEEAIHYMLHEFKGGING